MAPGYVTAWARKYLLTGAIGLHWLYKRSALGRYAPSCLSLINPIQTSAPVSNYYVHLFKSIFRSFYQSGTHTTADWFYSYFAIVVCVRACVRACVCVCVCVCVSPSVHPSVYPCIHGVVKVTNEDDRVY